MVRKIPVRNFSQKRVELRNAQNPVLVNLNYDAACLLWKIISLISGVFQFRFPPGKKFNKLDDDDW